VWDRLHAGLLGGRKRTGKRDLDTMILDGVTVRAFGGGEATGPSPVDLSRPGTKHTVMVSKEGVPPVIHTAGATADDHTQFLPMIPNFPQGGRRTGRPQRHASDRDLSGSRGSGTNWTHLGTLRAG